KASRPRITCAPTTSILPNASGARADSAFALSAPHGSRCEPRAPLTFFHTPAPSARAPDSGGLYSIRLAASGRQGKFMNAVAAPRTSTPLERIRILEPRHSNRSTGIINGTTSGILNWNDIPYPSFYRAYKELSTNFWIPDEVDMKGDARQYGELSAREKNAFDSIIGLLATLDSPQTRFIYNVAEYITDPAAHANAAIIGQQEVIHNESYSYVLA